MRRLALIVSSIAILLAGCAGHAAARPRPLSVNGRPVRPSRSYSYVQPGHDRTGQAYWRLCHVPLHGRRHCGPWHRGRRT